MSLRQAPGATPLSRMNAVLDRVLFILAGAGLTGMVALGCGNVLSRAVWVPIEGTFEMMGLFGAVVTAFSLSSTQASGGHITVGLLAGVFPGPVQRALDTVVRYVLLVLFAAITWRLLVLGWSLRASGELTETLRLPLWPFPLLVALGFFALFALQLLTCLTPLLCSFSRSLMRKAG